MTFPPDIPFFTDVDRVAKAIHRLYSPTMVAEIQAALAD